MVRKSKHIIFSSDEDDSNPNDPEKGDTPGDLGQKPNVGIHADSLVLNQKRTNVMIRKYKGVTQLPSGLRIKTGEGKEEYEQYDYKEFLGEGTFSINQGAYNTTLDKFFALKIYKVKEQMKADMWLAEDEKNINKIYNECRIWEKLVNKHIPRLYEWDENDKDDIVVARSELADIGQAGVFDEETDTYNIYKHVYDLFLEKIIKEDKILRKVDVPDQFMEENKAKKNHEVIDRKKAQEVLQPHIQKRIDDHKKLIEQQKKNEEEDPVEDLEDEEDFDNGKPLIKKRIEDHYLEDLEDKEQFQDFDYGNYDGLGDLKLVNTDVLKRPNNMTKNQKEILEKQNMNIEFYKELRDMSEPDQRQFVVGRMFFDICIGLYYMHLWKVAHQDIKLDNFVISSKDNGTAMLIDFNSTRQIEDETVKLHEVVGTKMFYAPEFSVVGRFQPFKYDMFSLGAVLYSLYYGKLCSADKNYEHDNIVFPNDTPYPILELMQGQLELYPSDRWDWDKVWDCLQFKMLHKKVEIGVRVFEEGKN